MTSVRVAPWALARLSLFPKAFAYESAPAELRARFKLSLYHTRAWSRLVPLVEQPRASWPSSLALYEARVAQRSEPHGFFGAVALCTRAADGPSGLSFADAIAELRPSASVLPIEPPAGLRLSSGFVPFALGGVVVKRGASHQQVASVTIPEELRDVLRGGSFTIDALDRRLQELEIPDEDAEELRETLKRTGVLGEQHAVVVENEDAWSAKTTPLQSLVGDSARLVGERVTEIASQLPNEQTIPLRASCAFTGQIAFPAAATEGALRTVALAALRHARVRHLVDPVAARLADWLDGRWVSLAELERFSWALSQAPSVTRPEPWDSALMAELRLQGERALRTNTPLDLSTLSLPDKEPLPWEGLLYFGWAGSRLVDVEFVNYAPRDFLGRYARLLPELDRRLSSLVHGDDEGKAEAEEIVLAYAGAGNLAEIADAAARGLRTLDFCGRGRDESRSLRLEDVHVTAEGRRLRFRLAATSKPVRIALSSPLNLSHDALHPLVTLLALERYADTSIELPYHAATNGWLVAPRVTCGEHVLSRRRIDLPQRKREQCTARALRTLLEENDFGPLVAVGEAEPVTLDLREDGAALGDIVKAWGLGKPVTIKEHLDLDGVEVDGRGHAARLLVPIAVERQSPKSAASASPFESSGNHEPESSSVGFGHRGPFATLKLATTTERVTAILRRFGACDVFETRDWFYVQLGAAGEVDLRIRVRESGSDDTVPTELFKLGNEVYSLGLCRRFLVEPYLREWDRYGGRSGIEVAERVFVVDSMALFAVVTRCAPKAIERLQLYVLCIIQFVELFAASVEVKHIIAMLRTRFGQLISEFDSEDEERKSISAGYRDDAPALLERLQNPPDDALSEALRQRREGLEGISNEADKDRARQMLPELIHMTGARLHLEDNRLMEARACFYAYRIIERLVATTGFPVRARALE